MSRLLLPGVLSQSFGSSPLPLDDTTSSVLAHSVAFKLRSDYTGDAIRVRRSSDDTEQDIGFAGNELDTAALLTFCGAGDGFIRRIYDQSGHASAVEYGQSTLSLQPQIVDAGSVVTKDGHPAMQHITSSQFVVSQSNWTTRPSAATVVEVWSAATSSSNYISIGSRSAVGFLLVLQDGSTSTTIQQDSGASVTWSKNGSLELTDGSSTRDDAHTALATNALNVVRHNAVSFADSVWDTIRTRWASNGYLPVDHWSSQIIYTDTAETATIEGRIAALYGIALA